MRTSGSTVWANRSIQRDARQRLSFTRISRSDFTRFEDLPEGFVNFSELFNLPESKPDTDALQTARSDLIKARKIKGLAKLRLEKGFSQVELADMVGTSQPRLSMWEKGTEKPSFENIKKLRSILNVEYQNLMEALDD